MIVCSKRAFLNILTQLFDANTLLNANYYIADQTTRNGIAQLSDSIEINDEGEYYINQNVEFTAPMLNPYHIHYGDGTLSPITLMSQTMIDQSNLSVDEMFKRQLMQNTSLSNVYKYLYGKKPEGNGLRILMFVNDACVPYMYIVCEYISQLFGEDITFVDRQYRNDINGQFQYKGDRNRATQVINELRDYNLLKEITDLASNFQYGYSDTNNLENYFNVFPVPRLFYIYEHLFPNEPLPVGNYTKERIVYIITHKLMNAFPKRCVMDNLMIPSFADMSSLYNGISDDELMCIHE